MPTAERDGATLWFPVGRAPARVDRAGDAPYRQELGVSLAEFLVLGVVDTHPRPLTQQAIADRLGLTTGAVGRQVELAVESGRSTAEASPHSRREHVIRLTREDTALARQGDALPARSPESDMPVFDPAELAVTIRSLSALNAARGEAPSPEWSRA